MGSVAVHHACRPAGVKSEVRRAQAAAAEHGEVLRQVERGLWGLGTGRNQEGGRWRIFSFSTAMPVQLVQGDRGVIGERVPAG
jgi:hypothetical protein